MLSTALALQHSVLKHMQPTNIVTHTEMSPSQQFLGSFFHIVHVYTKMTFSVFKYIINLYLNKGFILEDFLCLVQMPPLSCRLLNYICPIEW